MKELTIQEIQSISGAEYADYKGVVDISLIAIGGYLGTSLAYIRPLMNQIGSFYVVDPHIWVASFIFGIEVAALVGTLIEVGINYFYETSS